MEILGSVDKKF